MTAFSIQRYGIQFGLVVSLSLATGYVAGRIHAQNSAILEKSPGLGLVAKSDSRPAGEGRPHRTTLNPNPVIHQPSASTSRTASKAGSGALTRYPEARTEVSPQVTKNIPAAGPRHIGELADPDDPTYGSPVSEPRHIGKFVDPDMAWSAESEARVSIGEYREPGWES